MAEEEDSDFGESTRRRNKRKIVMRIEYGDSSSDISADEKVGRRKEIPEKRMDGTARAPMQEFSDHSVWEEDWHSDKEAAGPSQKGGPAKEDGDSDSSTGSNAREKCPICLFSFTNQEVGKPENCDHKFCAICIEEWSKNVSTCPIDRKEFLKIICLENFHNPTVTREISVDLTNKCGDEVVLDVGDDDMTYCRICSRSDHEESMLLCDGCNQGYHMECLVPALQEVPLEFWYCDECFASNEDDDPDDELALQEEIAELMDEVREFGIPETRLRIRTEVARNSPRILRTRQSERIRDAILARTNRRSFREATREVAAEDVVAMPGPSRMHTSVRIVRSINTGPAASTTRRSSTRRTRRRVNRKTVVVEYDVDHEDDKFAIKTKKIYRKIKRRRRKKRKEAVACRRQTNALSSEEFANRFSSTNRMEFCNDPIKDELTLTRSRAGIPSLSITGNRNSVEYFSSGDEDDDELATGGFSGSGGAGGGGLSIATRSRTFGPSLRSLRNRKGGLIIPESALPSTSDVLSSIMNEQERWMTISSSRNINKIKIKPDGSLEYEGDTECVKKGDKRLPRGTMAAAGVTDVSVRMSSSRTTGEGAANNQSSGSSNGTVGSTSFNSNAATSTMTGPNGGTGGVSSSTTPFPDIRTAAARKAPPAADLKVLAEKSDEDEKKAGLDDSSDDDCPNFSVYSAETMALAKNISEPNETGAQEQEKDESRVDEEREEDLVQLDDDEDEDVVEGLDESLAEVSESAAKGGSNKKCELELHDDSDWDELNNDKGPVVDNNVAKPVDGEAVMDLKDEQRQEETDQLNTESISEDEEAEMVVNDNNSRRSLTPCLDEKHPEVDVENDRCSVMETVQTGRKTEDLELISDDDMAEQNLSNKSTKRDHRQGTEADEFKRLSKTTKERNYRDKDRRSPSPKKRARSPEKKREAHSPLSRSRNRRKDLVRYDVRNVIEGRKQRPDKYGRDTTTQKRSRSKSRSSSLSSLSPDETRRSRSRSRRRRSRSRSRSRSLRRHHRRGGRESKSPARRPRGRVSRSPATRKRRSLSRFTMSPSASRSPSPALHPHPTTVGRLESPERRAKHQSPSRIKNGRSEQRKKEERRALSPVVALSQRRRRRSRSMSSSSSPTKQQQPPHHKNQKSRYTEPDPLNKSWTPPLRTEDRLLEPAGNFKVVVKNSGASKKEKKAKRRKLDKKRETAERSGKKEKKKKSKQSGTKTAGPSKEVFHSGDNILVSVNFSSKRAAAPALVGSTDAAMNSAQTTIVTLPPSKDQIVTQKQRQEQRQLQREKALAEAARSSTSKSGAKSRRAVSPSTGRTTTLVVTKNRRHRKVDAKPVAIIDLDGSPFRVMTPSPKAVIVLSDSDGEAAGAERKNKKSKKAQPEGSDVKKSRQQEPPSILSHNSKVDAALSKRLAGASVAASAATVSGGDDVDNGGGTPPQPPPSLSSGDKLPNAMNSSSSSAAMMDNSGPKTPPEPTMKFSMSMRSKSSVLRTANPLHDAREEEEEEEEQQQTQQHQQQDQQMPQEKTNTNGSSEVPRTVIPQTEIDPLISTAQAATNIGDTSGLSTGQSSVAVNSVDQSSSANSIAASSANNSGTGSSNKIGPNTPPEPAPTSPDAYDPFEPTKSNSVSPVQDMDLSSSKNVDQRGSSGTGAPIKIVNSPRHKDLRSLDEHKGKIPVSDLVMKLLNSTAGHHHHVHHLSGSNSDMGMVGSLSPPPPPPPYLEKSLERGAESQGAKGITILSNVVIQSGKGADTGAQASGKSLKHVAAYSTMNSTTTSYSIMKQMQTEAKRMLYSKHKATPPSIVTTATATTCTPTLTQAMLKKHNAECTLMDIAAESPYSPGSSDFDDLFEPPMETTRIPSMPAPSPMKGGSGAVAGKNQAELFDSIFGSHSPPTTGGQKAWTPSKARKQQQQQQSGRGHSSTPRRSSHNRKPNATDDDVPDSAVDLVLKENYIKKLNRQERVVEEVKIVLRPHFRRKYITKDDYKEIMRKSVSKICNSRSGEINPQKIKAFIDAYVQKYRYRRKYGTSAAGATSTGVSNSGAALVTTSSSSSMGVSGANQNKSTSTAAKSKSRWT